MNKVKLRKDNDVDVQVIRQEEVIDYIVIRVSHIKSRVYNIQNRDFQKFFRESMVTNCTYQKGD